MKIIKELCLLLAGSLIGIGVSPFSDEIGKHLSLIVIFIALLILVGIGLLDWIYIQCVHFVFFVNSKLRVVCIFAPYEITSDNSSWVDLSLRQIFESLKHSKIKFSVIGSQTNFKQYPVVINPYGGVYPERDLSALKSLDDIFSYVKSGGVYINIADIPFYYAYDENLNRRIDTTPLADNFSQVRSFLQTALTNKLHCLVYGLTSGENFKAGATRVIELPENGHNLYGKEILIDSKKFTPILDIPYGKGYFVFSTLIVNKSEIGHTIKTITKSLSYII
jgi:hypothetical protein